MVLKCPSIVAYFPFNRNVSRRLDLLTQFVRIAACVGTKLVSM